MSVNARYTDPVTSHMADRDNAKYSRDKQKSMVLDAVRRFPGRTSKELAHIMAGMQSEGLVRFVDPAKGDVFSQYNEIFHRRLSDLAKSKDVEKSGVRQCSVSTRSSVTWNPCNG